MTEDFYDLLEISADASQDEVKEAYREQVRVYHPDLNDDDRAQAQFTAVQTAYDILGDPVERQAYDRLGHEDYVAKRTSGLPSPDVWKSTDDSSADSVATESASDSKTETSRSQTTGSGSRRATSSSSTGSSRTTSTGSTTATGSKSTTSSGSTTRTASSGTATAGRHSTGSTDGGTVHGTTGSGRTASESDRFGDNAVVQWWRRQNFAWPLIWLSVLTYLVGLGQYILENVAGIELLWTELAAVGADPAAIWDAVTSERYGIQSPIEFVIAAEPVAPPLPPMEWYGLLGGLVAIAVLAVGIHRAVWRSNTWGSVTINETIVVALALGIATTLLGGPFLAGAVLMPVLFGVIVYTTHQLPGWSPSYLYVAFVLAPAAGLAAGVAGVRSLPAEVLAVVVVALLGALGLPLRATIRKRFGR